MIGSFPIGSVPYGSNEIADSLAKQIVTTLLAQANGVAFDFNIGLVTTLAAQADSVAFDLNIGVATIPAIASGQAYSATSKLFVHMLLAQAGTQAYDSTPLRSTISDLANASGQAYNATTKLSLSVDTLFAQANTESYGAITSPVLGSGLSSVEAYDFSPVTVYADDVVAVAQAYDFNTVIGILAESASASAEAYDSGVLRTVTSDSANASAQAYRIDPVRIYADDVVAVAVAYDIIPKSYLQTLTASASAQAYGMELGLDADDVVATTQVYGFNLRLQSSTAISSSQAYDIIPKVTLSLEIAQASAQAYSISQVDLETDEVVAVAQAYNITPRYTISDVPNIVVTRSSNLQSNEIKVLNSSIGNVNIYRASDHKGLFTKIATDQTSPYTDSGLDTSLNYKYRAVFVVNGNIGGSPVEQEGQKSQPRYTIGNRTL